jgi:hypothetical protein
VLLLLLFAIGLFYLAVRIILNGFLRPQSEKLNGFGVLACVLLGLMALSVASKYF